MGSEPCIEVEFFILGSRQGRGHGSELGMLIDEGIGQE
jgi:hypothetical protein